MKVFTIFTTLFFLAGCALEEQAYPEPQVIISTPRQAMYPSNYLTAVILKKRTLTHNREQYYARLCDGRDIMFTADSPLHYETGDKIVIPR